MKTITSRQNPLVARFRAVARAHRSNRQQILLEGTRLIDDAREAGTPLEVAVVSSGELRRRNRKLMALSDALAGGGVEVVAASDAVLAALSPVRSPSGAVAIAAHRPRALRDVFTSRGLVLALVGVKDPGNVGAIVRAADAGAVSGVLVTAGSADPFGWRALRGAMGSSFRLPVVDVDNIGLTVEAARERGAGVLAAVPRGGASLYSIDLTRPQLVLLGSEGSGLNDEVVSLADTWLTVPMRQPVQSLNTAVAAALIIYEARRQRRARA